MLKDQKELLSEFNAQGVEYLIVGGHAVNAHGVPRTTKDLDLLVRPEQPNSDRVLAALVRFGAPLGGITEADFRGNEEQVFQIGVEPNRIDILQNIDGVSFESAWTNRVKARIDGELVVPFISREDLILNKENTGRTRDLADAEELREVDRVRQDARQLVSIGGIELLDTSNESASETE